MESPIEAPDSDRARLRHLVACSRRTPNALSKLAGLSPAHIGMVLRGDIKAISKDTAKALARVTGCSVGWLLAGEGDAPREEDVVGFVDAISDRAANSPRPVGADHTASDFTVDSDPTGPVVVREGFDQTGTG